MSQINVDAIRHTSASSDAITLASNGKCAVTYKAQWIVNSGYGVLNGSSSHIIGGYNNQYAIGSESSILLMEVS